MLTYSHKLKFIGIRTDSDAKDLTVGDVRVVELKGYKEHYKKPILIIEYKLKRILI